VGASLVYLVAQVARAPSLALQSLQLHAGWLAFSVLLHAALLMAGTFLWLWVLRRFEGPEARYAPLLEVWAASSLTRYLPGGVWQLLVADRVGKRHGLHRQRLFASLAVHTGLSLLSAAGVALAFVGELPVPGWMSALAWALLPLAMLFTHQKVLNGCINLLRRLGGPLREGLPAWKGSWGMALGLLFLGALSWVLYGVALTCFLRSVLGPEAAPGWRQVVGANALAFIAGYLALFAPGGLGVRELALASLLRPALPPEVAAAVALLSRLWSVLAELLTLAVAWKLNRAKPATEHRGASEG
jgi:uncharacterized membrane protein YbhN (UPF0104 family)